MCLCAQSRPALCDSMDSGPPDSSVHGFFQTRTLSGLSFPPPGDFPLQVLNLCLLRLLLWQVDSLPLSLSHSQSSFLVKLLASTKWSTLCWVPWKPKPWSRASFPGVCHYVPCDVGCATHLCGCALGWVQRPGLCDLSPFSALHSWMQ